MCNVQQVAVLDVLANTGSSSASAQDGKANRLKIPRSYGLAFKHRPASRCVTTLTGVAIAVILYFQSCLDDKCIG
jgi:hypothetical protein